MTKDELHDAAMALPGATMNVQWGDDLDYLLPIIRGA